MPIKIIVHIEDGVFQGLYTDNPDIEYRTVDVDDQGEIPVLVSDYKKPDVVFRDQRAFLKDLLSVFTG